MGEQRRAETRHLTTRASALVCLAVVACVALAACAPSTPPASANLRAAHMMEPVTSFSSSAQAASVARGAEFRTGAPPITARAAELYDVSTGKMLLAVNASQEMPMASTTKIMTAVVALTYGRLDQAIRVGPDAVKIESQGTSICGLALNEILTLREMLYCLMLPSGDDAALAIADGVGGSQDGFVALMNLEAGLLGLSHTHYANPHGLDETGHYTTAADLIKLTEYATRSPTFAKIVSTPTFTLPATAKHHKYLLTNTNELLPGEPFAYRGAIGVKTGYTGGAGYCLVFMATRPQGTLIGVVLGEPQYNARFTDAAALLTWGYAQLPATAPQPAATATASAG